MNERKILVSDLSTKFNVSPSSIRLDLTELEKRGLLRRTYGGAMLPDLLEKQIILHKSVLQTRQKVLIEEKEPIGNAAAHLIEDGDSLILDGGSTVECFAQ